MKKLISLLLAVLVLTVPVFAEQPEETDAMQLSAPSAVLMEQSTGEVLYEKDAHARLSPASVTKIMTMLLIAEQIDSGALQLTDTVTASATAAAMGGSQIWLEPGESMTVDEMLKCIAVASANDCAVAMAEHLSGTESAFAERMNTRAAELGMEDTHFINCTGLTEEDTHYTSAYDIALMSRELLKHDWIRQYTTIWMDTVRGGEFGLTNTNKLVRFYDGITGLKTGYTRQAMYCLSATAERDGLGLIAVIMHGESSDQRNSDARALLDYGFASYMHCSPAANVALPPVRVRLGAADSLQPVLPEESDLIVPKGSGELTYDVELPETLTAPIAAGDEIGTVTVSGAGGVIAKIPILAAADIERVSTGQMWVKLIQAL